MEISWCRFQLLLLASACVCSLERITHNPTTDIFCPQGLSNCRVNNTNPLSVNNVNCGPVHVCNLGVQPKLCCDVGCKPCLWINIQLRVIADPESYEVSGYEDENSEDGDFVCDEDGDEKTEYPPCNDQLSHLNIPATVAICYSSAGHVPSWCKRLDLIVSSATSPKTLNLTLVEYEGIEFGTVMQITVGSDRAEVKIPTLQTVCSSHKDINECKGPTVHFKIDNQSDVVRVQLAKEEGRKSEPLSMCMKRGRDGKCWNSTLLANTIPLKSITECTCFQVWKDGSPRSEYCPFEKHKEFKNNVLLNVSMSVAHTTTYDGHPVLSWNLTAPCRVKAELWPCQVGAHGKCSEVKGFRQMCCNETDWEENITTLWASGKFVNIRSRNHLQLCVMLQVNGKIVNHYCQHPLERRYRSVSVLLLIIITSAIIGILLLLNKLKCSLSEWDRRYSQEKGRHVLLLHSASTGPGQARLCKLKQLLSELGFEVSLDLCSQSEISSLGPAPWLHSKLCDIQTDGGKALIILSLSTLQIAEWYWNVVSKSGKEKKEKYSHPSSYSSDVLGAALGCILADCKNGGAAQRFVLVQLDSHEHLINEECEMPKLFRGLPLYNLPSQTQGLLMELCLERPSSVSGKLKKMWWMKRARRKLAQGMLNICNGKRARTESVLTQEDSLSLDIEDTEKVFLKNEQLQ